MARSLGAGLTTDVASDSAELVGLLEVNTSGGVTRIATTPVDVDWDSVTWEGVGGSIRLGPVQETADRRGQGMPLQLSGVDQSIISLLLNNFVRGRVVKLYWAHMDRDTGDFLTDPYLVFRGWLNESWSIVRKHSQDMKGGTVTVSTKATSRLSELQRRRQVRTNPTSHQEMLRRAGFTGNNLMDRFFRFIPELVGKKIYWGTEAPHQAGDTRYGGTGGGGYPGGRDGEQFRGGV